MNKLTVPSAGSSTRFLNLERNIRTLLPFETNVITYALTKCQNKFDQITVVIKDNEALYMEFWITTFKNVVIKKVSQNLTHRYISVLGADGEKNLTVMLSDALYDFDILEMPNDSVSAMDVSIILGGVWLTKI